VEAKKHEAVDRYQTWVGGLFGHIWDLMMLSLRTLVDETEKYAKIPAARGMSMGRQIRTWGVVGRGDTRRARAARPRS
jgi:hypothetical protein